MTNFITKLRKNYLLALLLLSLSLFWIIYTFHDRLEYQSIKKVNYTNFDIEKNYPEPANSKIKDVNINLLLKIDKKNEVSTIFNFGTEEKPLILRLIKPSTFQIVIGHNNPLKNKVYTLTDLFEFEKSHKLDIRIYKEKQLWVLYDDVIVINIFDKDINFDISNIKIERNLGETISDVNIKYALYRKSGLITLIKYILVLFFIALSIQLLKKNVKFLTRKEKIKYVVYILFLGFLMAVFYSAGQNILGYKDPKNTFLFTPGNIFSDFTSPVKAPDVITYSFFTTIIKRIFFLIGTEISLMLFILSSLVFFTLINLKEIGDKKLDKSTVINIVIFSLLSYPLLFTVNRGNMEIFVFFLLYLFASYLSKKKFLTSAFFLSLAISMKLFPVVFLVVFLSFKKFRVFFFACLSTLLINLISYVTIFFQSSNIIKKMMSEYFASYTGSYMKAYAIDNRGLDFGHSLYGLLKLRIFSFYKSTSITDVTLREVTSLFKLYSFIEIGLFAFLSSYVVFIEKELWKKITLLVIAMNLLPYISADYKLINFFVPLYLFLNKKEKSKTDLIYVILFSLLLVPKNYYTTLLNLPDISLAVFLNPILMILLMVLIIFEGLRNIYYKGFVK